MRSRPLFITALSSVLLAGMTPALAATAQTPNDPSSALAGPPVSPSILSLLRHDDAAQRYPDAAVEHVLEDIAMTVAPDGTYTESKREIVRVLNKRGQDGWSEGEEGYDQDHQALELDWARTIEPDGHVLPVSANAIKDDSPFSDYPSYDHYRVRTWTFPASIPGAIVDYHVTLHDQRPELDRDFADDDSFSDFQPARKRIYSISMPAGRRLFWHVNHPDPATPVHFSEATHGDRTVYRWEVDHQGFTLSEQDMPPEADLEPSVWVTTVPTWQAVNAWWLKVNARKATPTAPIRSLVARLTKGITDPDRKAQALYDWVVANIRYVYVDMQYTGFESMSADQVLRRQYGDCKGGSTLLLAMLRAAGIKASYALLQTAPAGHLVTDSPSLQFDHCIVAAELPKGLTFLDNVGKTVPYGTLPAMDQGALAMVTKPAGPDFETVPLAAPTVNQVASRRDVALAADGSATVSVSVKYSGLEDSSARDGYQDLSPARIEETFEKLAADATDGGSLLTYHVTDPLDLDTPMEVRYSYRAPAFADRAGDLLIFPSPGFDPGMSSFELGSRSFAMWFDSRSQAIEQTVIHLPAGCTVRYLPSDARADLPDVGFSGSYRQVAGEIRFTTTLAWKQRQIAPAAYGPVRDLLRRRAIFGKQLLVVETRAAADSGRKKGLAMPSRQRRWKPGRSAGP